MTNTSTPTPRPSTPPAQLLIGTCPTCWTPRGAFANTGPSTLLECGSCGSVHTDHEVSQVTGSVLNVIRRP